MDAARIHLDAVISPKRSLPAAGFKVLIGVLFAVNLVLGCVFLSMGAAPVPIFLGLDVLGLLIAFRISYRRALLRERVVVTADHVRVVRGTGAKACPVWTSPTAFTGVELAQDGRRGPQVRLRLSGKRLLIAQGLGSLEREALAERLQAAIAAARAERHPSQGAQE